MLATSASQGEGIDALECEIATHRSWLQESGALARRRVRAAETEVLVALRSSLHRQLVEKSAQTSGFAESIHRVLNREITPRRAAAQLAEQLVAG